MATCPNKNLESWKALERARGDMAYYLWDKYEGNVPESEYTPQIKPGVAELFESNFLIFAESKTSDEVISKLLSNKIIDKKCN